MKFGTYYFFQAHPRYSHPEIIHRELDLTMAFCGRTQITQVDKTILVQNGLGR